jgi:hypothetical protein
VIQMSLLMLGHCNDMVSVTQLPIPTWYFLSVGHVSC